MAKVAVVTVSDGVSQGTREDRSGEEAERLLREAGFDDVARLVVPDEQAEIEGTLRELASERLRAGGDDRVEPGSARAT